MDGWIQLHFPEKCPLGGAKGPLGKPNDERHSQQSSEEQGAERSTVYQKGYQKGGLLG